MKITIKALGKLSPEFQKLILTYLNRLSILKVKIIEQSNNNKSVEWLFNNPKNAYTIVLTENGSTLSSLEFSNFLFSLPNKGYSNLVLIIGGAQGLSSSHISKANYQLSFGKLTFPHEIFRVLLLEQLYRAETIFLKHPYHK